MAAPEVAWSSPVFFQVNLTVSLVWTLVFLLDVVLGLLAIYIYPQNVYGRVIPSLILLLFALQFTKFYPPYARAQALAKRRQREDMETAILHDSV